MKSRFFLFWAVVLCLITTNLLTAEIPLFLNYQGQLTDNSNNPVSDGNYDMTFRIYESEGAVSELWNSGVVSVLVINGVFNVQLGASPMTSLPSNIFNVFGSCYLGIQVGTDPEMSPRIPLTSSAYSFQALRADTANVALNVIGGSEGGWSDDGSEVHLANSNDSVGIGTDNPQAKLHVQTPVNSVKLGMSSYGLYADHPMSNTYSYLAGSNIGVYGYSDDLYGVQGNTYNGYAIWGGTSDNFGTGVYGTNINGNYATLGSKGQALFAHAESGYSGYFEGKMYISGLLGVNELNPINNVDVSGRMAIGSDYAGTITAPTNGLAVQGKVGIGTSSVTNTLDIANNVAIGSSYAGSQSAPASGMIVQGDVGIGTSSPIARLHVAGNLHLEGTERDISWKSTEQFQIGTYNGTTFTERMRLTNDGKVGIGTVSPQDKLQVFGNIRLDSGPGNGNFLRFVEDGTMRWTFLHRPWATASFALRDESGSRDVMSFESGTGYVGVNNTDPSATLDVNGDLEVTGAFKGNKGPNNGAPFPRPAYNSGWISIDQGSTVTLTHGVAGDINNYVVDLTFKTGGDTNINERNYGGVIYTSPESGTVYHYGAYWHSLNASTIKVTRLQEDAFCPQFRIRIWFIE